MLFIITDCVDEMHFAKSNKAVDLKLTNNADSWEKKLLIPVGDADDWKRKYKPIISELFAVETGIATKEHVVDMVRKQKKYGD